MNKGKIIAQVSKKTGLKKPQVRVLLNTFLEAIMDGLVSEEYVSLPGFGSWTVKKTKSCKSVNPRTGEPCVIPSSVVVRFKAGNVLKHEKLGSVRNECIPQKARYNRWKNAKHNEAVKIREALVKTSD